VVIPPFLFAISMSIPIPQYGFLKAKRGEDLTALRTTFAAMCYLLRAREVKKWLQIMFPDSNLDGPIEQTLGDGIILCKLIDRILSECHREGHRRYNTRVTNR